MSAINNIEKIPESVRQLVEAGLSFALKKGNLGKTEIDFIQIESYLSGGKTGAVVFVARYGIYLKTTFLRVLKIASREVCESENAGYAKTRETLLDIFSQIEYYPEDEFEYKKIEELNDKQQAGRNRYGILLYQDVGAIATSDLKGIARYFSDKLLSLPSDSMKADNFARELSLLLQKEVFLGLKKGLYGSIKRKRINLNECYGYKLNSDKVKRGIEELIKIDPEIARHETILEYFNTNAIYHEVNYVHGDLNIENVLVWENERNFLNCKVIDFGEVIPKKKDNFTPLFWDLSRLLGGMIVYFLEELLFYISENHFDPEFHKTNSPIRENESSEEYFILQEDNPSLLNKINLILDEFWLSSESFLKGAPGRNPLDMEPRQAFLHGKIKFIIGIFFSTIFDFINEAKSGLKDLRNADVIKDYFYCQVLFFIFFAKFPKESIYKRIFGVRLASKLYQFAISSESRLQSIILSLEKFYFEFSSSKIKNKLIQKGPAPGARSPFMGLSYFHEKDREFFFGREKFTNKLLNSIAIKSIVALSGASGSGKSSVVYAGIIPELRKQNYLIYAFRPGSTPIQSAIFALDRRKAPRDNPGDLQDLIISILRENPDKKLFLLGDQFEEIFTLRSDPDQREELAYAIIECAKIYKDRFKFFITIRSDFWTKLLEDSGFSSIVGDCGDYKYLGERFFLSPMNIEELRSAIEKPLTAANLQIQEGLTDLILSSISREPGSLPLLEFCLEELWKKQIDSTLCYEAYKSIGEVKGALATYAENVYFSLSNIEKESLKKIMLQLTQPGQGTEDTRRVAILDEIISHNTENQIKIEEFIHFLADKRLIVTGTNQFDKRTVEVAHEALIREWKRLKEWMDSDREFRVWQEKVRYAIGEWETGKREDGLLLHGSSRVTAEEWYEKRKNDLGSKEIEFIEKSFEVKENKERKRKEEEARKKKLQRTITVSSVVGVVIAVGLSYFAFREMRDSEANELEARAHSAIAKYETKKDYLQNYYEILKASLKGQELDEKYSTTKLTILSTLYSYTYNLQEPEVYEKPEENRFAFIHEIYSFSGHGNYYESEDFSPDGKFIASASKDNTIELWNTFSSDRIATLSGHTASISSIKFSPDGKMIASASNDGTIIVRDTISGKNLNTIHEYSKNISSIIFSSDSKIIAIISNEKTIKLRDAITGNILNTIDDNNSISSIRFSPDNKIIAGVSEDKTIKLWDSFTGKLINKIKAHSSFISNISFSPDGKIIASASRDKTIKLWDFVSGKELNTLWGHNDFVLNVNFSSDGKTIISASADKTIKLWETSSGKELKTLYGHSNPVKNAQFSQNGIFIISLSEDKTVKIWDVIYGKGLKTLWDHNDFVHSVKFSPNGKFIASASEDKTVKLWDAFTGKNLNTFIGHIGWVRNVSFSPDGKTIASASTDKTIILWDTYSGKKLKTFTGHLDWVKNVTFSPDGKTIASASRDSTVRLWNVDSGKEIKPIFGHTDCVNSVSFSPIGKILISASDDNTIKLWDAYSGNELKSLTGHTAPVNSVSFSPDGDMILSASSDNTIKLWDTYSGTEIKTLFGHSSFVMNASFSPNGKIIVSSSRDNTIKIWDAYSGKEFKTLSGHSDSVNSVSFSPNGETIVSASLDKTIKLWDMEIKSLLPLACMDLTLQMNHWLTLTRAPYPEKEIRNIQNECKKILWNKFTVLPQNE